jgi:hypothetical protein
MMAWKRAFRGRAATVLLGMALLGCRYQGDGIDNPFERRVRWFSFVAGDDIRESCRPSTSDRYRLVYNGFWREQVRIYELGTGGAAVLSQRVIERGSLALWSSGDPLGPWRGKTAETPLGAEARDRLVASLAAIFAPPPDGLRLPSDGFYWTAVACVGGHFFSNAWLFPSAEFEALSFPRELLAADQTGVPFHAPDAMDYVRNYDQPHLAAERWFLTVGKGGLLRGGGL